MPPVREPDSMLYPAAKEGRMLRLPLARHLYVVTIVLSLGSCAGPGGARDSEERASQGSSEDPIIAELLTDLSVVEEKIIALADGFTQEQYDWRPGEGVRSAGEVLMHVAAINVALPLFAGHEAPSSTGLTMENLPTAAPAYENSVKNRDGIRPELTASFEHLRMALKSTSASDLQRQVTVFGDAMTARAFWIGHLGHLHEHLGQAIAYGRTNGVAPPWSQ
jgi:hypothetical protein